MAGNDSLASPTSTWHKKLIRLNSQKG